MIRRKTMPPITTFETVTLHTAGMRFAAVYELVKQGSDVTVSQYRIRFAPEEKERIPEKRTVVGEAAVLQLLNDCQILSWDGFHGRHPRGVKDGTVFSFAAVVNGGTSIQAEGSQNFPKHYRNLTDGICALLNAAPRFPVQTQEAE